MSARLCRLEWPRASTRTTFAHHGAAEDAPEGHILPEHDGRIVSAECDAEGVEKAITRPSGAGGASRTRLGAYLNASRIAWYMFILRVSRPTTSRAGSASEGSSHRRPAVRSATSRVGLRKVDVATDGRWPPAGGGSVLCHRRLRLACCWVCRLERTKLRPVAGGRLTASLGRVLSGRERVLRGTSMVEVGGQGGRAGRTGGGRHGSSKIRGVMRSHEPLPCAPIRVRHLLRPPAGFSLDRLPKPARADERMKDGE